MKSKDFIRIWSECRDSNPRPLGPEPSAIPNFATPRQPDYYSKKLLLCQEEIQRFCNLADCPANWEERADESGANIQPLHKKRKTPKRRAFSAPAFSERGGFCSMGAALRYAQRSGLYRPDHFNLSKNPVFEERKRELFRYLNKTKRK